MGTDDRTPRIASPAQQLRLFVWQACSLGVLCGVLWQFGEQELARAALIGGSIAIFPYHYFAARAFRFQGAGEVARFRRGLARGQVGRYLLTGALFAVVLTLDRTLDPWALFGAFVFILVTQIIATVVVLFQPQAK